MEKKGEWLQGVRNRFKKTAGDVAAAASMSECEYASIENGEHDGDFPTDAAKRIADAIGFNMELFYREPDVYIGKQAFFINFVSVDRETGKERKEHQKDATNPARFDGFAQVFGYRRIIDS